MGDGWNQARPSFMSGGSGLGQMYKPGQNQDGNKYDKGAAAAMRTGRDPNQNAASDLRAMLYKDGDKDQVRQFNKDTIHIFRSCLLLVMISK